jgi:hypothetical protein
MIPEEIVKQAEATYDALDLERIMELFDPQIVVYWNGQNFAKAWMNYASGMKDG